MTAEEIRNEVRNMDPDEDENSDNFLSCCMLLASAEVGGRITKVWEFLGKPPYSRVSMIGNRFYSNGVWDRATGKVYHSGWDDEETGAIAFVADSMIGTGLLARCGGD